MDSENSGNEAMPPQTSLETEESHGCRKKRRKENPVRGRKITSWEMYNILLRKLVDQLIYLGASKKIKIVAFKLWASYLQLSGVAFVAKYEKKLPALSLGFRNEDVKTLYGIKNLRKKLFTRKRKYSERDSNSPSESSEVARNVPEQEERDLNDATNAEAITSKTEEQLNQFNRKKRLVFNSSASKAVKEISGQITECYDSASRLKMNTKTKTQIKRLVYDRRFNDFEKCPSTPLTIVTLITIVRVALQIVGDEIFLGDILRWICEGRISFNQSSKLISSCNLNIQNDLLSLKRQGFMLDIRNFTRSLKLKYLPTPNLFCIAERYCKELNLPNKFCQLVLKLMVDSNVAMEYSKYNFRIFPDYECRVMAVILFVFKLLYSLDDVTEHHLSEFVDLVIQLSDDDVATAGIPKLFSWRKWVQFIECRKAVLSMHDVATNNLSYNNGVSNSNIFLNYWEKVKSSYQVTDKTINPQLLSSLSQRCHSLSQENVKNEESIQYPVSLTPFKTYTEHLMVNHPKLLRRRSRKILSEDFSQYSVNVAGNSKWYSNIAEQVGLNVEIINPSRHFDKIIFHKQNSSLLALSKTVVPRADILVAVLIEENDPSDMISNNEGIIRFKPSIHENEFNLEMERRDNSIKIFDPLPYWCFHECYKRMNVEEFEDLAIKNFPKSFLWLLRECASMLRASVKELYFELIFVEIMLSQLYCEKLKKNVAFKIDANEW